MATNLIAWKLTTLLILFLVMALWPFAVLFVDVYYIDAGQSDVFWTESGDSGEEPDIGKIPKNIHQIHPGDMDNSSRGWKSAQKSWTAINPDFKHILWNSTSIKQVIVSKYSDLTETYTNCENWAQKLEIARYIILHQYGCIYADMDLECLKSMKDLLEIFPRKTEMVLLEAYPGGISVDFIISKQNHRLLASAIRGHKRDHWIYRIPLSRSLLLTGSSYFGARYNALKNKNNVLFLGNFPSYLTNINDVSLKEECFKIVYYLFYLVTNTFVGEAMLCICIITVLVYFISPCSKVQVLISV